MLSSPILVYGDKESSKIDPIHGVWNMRNVKFIEAKEMYSFGLINITKCGDHETEFFISSLTKVGCEMGKPNFC